MGVENTEHGKKKQKKTMEKEVENTDHRKTTRDQMTEEELEAAEYEDVISIVFDELDSILKNGRLSMEELKAFAPKVPWHKMARMFDQDGDGAFSFEELKKIFRNKSS